MVSSRNILIVAMAVVLLLAAAVLMIVSRPAPSATPSETVIGSGTEAMKEYDLSGFTRIAEDGGFQAVVRQGDSYTVKVWTDDNIIPYLDVTVSGNTLRLGLRTDEARSFTTHSLRAEVTMPELTGLNLNGGSAAEVAGFTSSKDLAFELNGGSKATGDMTGANTKVRADGGSRIEIEGQGADLEVTTSGGSNVLLAKFAVSDVKVDLSGGGQTEVNASGQVTGKASGGAMVQVSGNPSSVNVETSGGSAVETD